ncbi:MAG: hypothetical protein HQ546_05490, partial [Planctomycetes bacterium]|nr:hypothetical protein [Planctomycetota bacterium]
MEAGFILGVDVLSVATSLAGFAAVVAAVLTLFGHGGRTEASPQRRIAVATGQSDRRTVFEWEPTAPLMWLLTRLMDKLVIPRTKQWL